MYPLFFPHKGTRNLSINRQIIDQKWYLFPTYPYASKKIDDAGRPLRKSPLVKWKAKCTNDEHSISAWYKKQFLFLEPGEKCSFGVVLGEKSGIFVLDIDCKNDVQGLQSLKKLEDAYGSLRANNFYVHTPSGGYHIYFHGGKGISSRAKITEYPGIELKSEGTYVIIIDNDYEIVNTPNKILACPEWINKLTTIKDTEADCSPIEIKHSIKILNEALEELDPGLFTGHTEWMQFIIAAKSAFGPEAEETIIDFCRKIPGYEAQKYEMETRNLFRKTNPNGRMTGATFVEILLDNDLFSLAKRMTRKYEKVIEEKVKEISSYADDDFAIESNEGRAFGMDFGLGKGTENINENKGMVFEKISIPLHDVGKTENRDNEESEKIEYKKDEITIDGTEKVQNSAPENQGTTREIAENSYEIGINDETIARMIVKLSENSICYVTEASGFFVYDKGIWQEDKNNVVGKRIFTITNELILLVKQSELTSKEKIKFVNRIKNIKNMKGHSNTLRALKEITAISITEFDKVDNLLCLNNGVINLLTGEFSDHDSRYLFTLKMNVTYDAKAKCPKYDRFMNEIMQGNIELRNYVERIIGLSMLGKARENIFPIFYGLGKNGKSTLVDVMHKAFGDYSHILMGDRLMGNNMSSNEYFLADLKSKRIAVMSESKATKTLDASLVKYATGGDMINARQIYQKSFTFAPQFTLILMTNALPIIRDRSEGMWRRVKLIPFKFKVSSEKRINDLKEQLFKEIPGIFNSWFAQLQFYLKNGIQEPDIVGVTTEEYKDDQDIIKNFINENCVVNENAKFNLRQIYSAFREYCMEAGNKEIKYLSDRAFLKELQKAYSLESKHTNSGNEWYGLGMLEKSESEGQKNKYIFDE